MSRHVASLVYGKRAGSMARKAILAYCAERANDDGSGIWASKSRIAKEVECSKQTVIDTLKGFVAEGILLEVGKRRFSNGYTVEYALNIAAVKGLPDAVEDVFEVQDLTGPKLDGSNQLTPRGQAAGPQGVKPVDPNRPLTVLKPSNTRKRDSDLFSVREEQTEGRPQPSYQDSTVPTSAEKERFEEFWNLYPKTPRKTEKAKCRSRFWDTVHGKRKDVEDPPTADQLISALKEYAATNPDPQYVPAPMVWLNKCRWEAYSNSGEFREEDLTANQRSQLTGGLCPPSLRGPDGKPNEVARHWLRIYGYHAEAAA